MVGIHFDERQQPRKDLQLMPLVRNRLDDGRYSREEPLFGQRVQVRAGMKILVMAEKGPDLGSEEGPARRTQRRDGLGRLPCQTPAYNSAEEEIQRGGQMLG